VTDINAPYRTSTDVVTEALSILGVLSAGGTVDPEDFNWINESLDATYRQLAGLEICYVADPNNIPGEWFKNLSAIVAGENASKFGLVGKELEDKINLGLGGSPGTNIEIGAGTAAKSLKIITRGKPTGEPLRFCNY
jgi:hypothetical protein